MRYLRSFFGLVVVFGGSALVCWWVFHTHDYIVEKTFNSDSLTILDFSRDLLRGESLDGWNLPRAPYFFPDALIASLVIIFGWSNNFSIITIASFNYSLLIITCYIVLRSAYGMSRISLPGIGLVVTASLFAITCIFPVSMPFVYWQIFASGTHFGTVVNIVLMLSLNKTLFKDGHVLLRVLFLSFLTVASVASNSMALLLLMFWLASEMFSAAWKRPKRRVDMMVVLFSAMIGAGLSSIIPRQSLAESFFSQEKFILALQTYCGWFFNSVGNAAFIILLVISTVAFPFLMQGRWPKSLENKESTLLGNDFILPSLGVIVVSPMFFTDVGTLRYLIFPAFILILCFVLMYFRLIGLVKNIRLRIATIFMLFLLVFSGIFYIFNKVKTESAYELNGAKSYQCIKSASLKYPLQDGVATYWNARPVKFYSNFNYYLAQIPPWRADGYFFWGNNWYEFLYKNTFTKLPREYNYILSTNAEILSGRWGDVINKSKNKVTCEAHTLFYFDNNNILWDYLFFRGPPPALRKTCIPESASCTFSGTDLGLVTQVGVREGGVIKANGQPGFLVYGPYSPLQPGVYRLVVKGNLSGSSKVLGDIDVAADFGKRILVAKPIIAGQSTSGNIVSLDFEVAQPITNIEFRIKIQAQTVGYFIAYELTKIGRIK